MFADLRSHLGVDTVRQSCVSLVWSLCLFRGDVLLTFPTSPGPPLSTRSRFIFSHASSVPGTPLTSPQIGVPLLLSSSGPPTCALDPHPFLFSNPFSLLPYQPPALHHSVPTSTRAGLLSPSLQSPLTARPLPSFPRPSPCLCPCFLRAQQWCQTSSVSFLIACPLPVRSPPSSPSEASHCQRLIS